MASSSFASFCRLSILDFATTLRLALVRLGKASQYGPQTASSSPSTPPLGTFSQSALICLPMIQCINESIGQSHRKRYNLLRRVFHVVGDGEVHAGLAQDLLSQFDVRPFQPHDDRNLGSE